jgi:hypothetical protein
MSNATGDTQKEVPIVRIEVLSTFLTISTVTLPSSNASFCHPKPSAENQLACEGAEEAGLQKVCVHAFP